MNKTGKIESVNRSNEKGEPKTPINEGEIICTGLKGDAYEGEGLRQISMLSKESILKFNKEHNKEFLSGEFAENITTIEIDLKKIALLDRFIIGDCELEVSGIGSECHVADCTIKTSSAGSCLICNEGIFLRVVKTGKIKTGDTLLHFPRILSFKIITLRDKNGEENDERIPLICEMLKQHFKGKGVYVDRITLKDDKNEFQDELESIINGAYDVLFITGGKENSPKEVIVDVVQGLCDSIIPDVMENIHLKYGEKKAKALHSRSVAGIIKNVLVYTLPGNPNAIKEYLNEILKNMEHTIHKIHGLKP